MTDGPTLRNRIERERRKVARIDERIATLEARAKSAFPPLRFIARAQLLLARFNRNMAQRSALWAKRRLMGMVI